MLKLHDYKLNQKFDLQTFKDSFSQLKKVLRVLKFDNKLYVEVQAFLTEYHVQLCKSISSSSFTLSIADISQIYKTFRSYSYNLEKYNVVDVGLNKFLQKLNSSIFDQLSSQILFSVKNSLTCIVISNYQHQSSFDVFDVMFKAMSKYAIEGPKLKISFDLMLSMINKVVASLTSHMLNNKDMDPYHISSMISHVLGFNSKFTHFINKNKDCHLDAKFVDKITIDCINSINKLIIIGFNEIENCFDRLIQSYFANINNFSDIDLRSLLDENYVSKLQCVKTILPEIYVEPLYNRVLYFLLKFYFTKSFLVITSPEYDHKFIDKMKHDKEFVVSTFSTFIHAKNLQVLTSVFDYLIDLLSDINYKVLFKAIINFNLFFSNQLTTEVLTAILACNLDIPINIEEELIQYFNSCIMVNKQKNKPANAQQNNISAQSKTKKLWSYLPSVTLSISNKLRRYVFLFKRNNLRQKQQNSINLSLDLGLVNESANERYLENTVKLTYFDQADFNIALYAQAMQVI